MLDSNRRGFIGACFAGLAGTAVAATLGPAVTVTKKLVIPKNLLALDGVGGLDEDSLCYITSLKDAAEQPEFASILDSSKRPDVWFGVTQRQISRMTSETYCTFIQAHLEVNRAYGVAGNYRTSYSAKDAPGNLFGENV